MPVLCKFFNSPAGCAPPTGKCAHKHVLYCTNPLCEGASAKTHTIANCGRKGGGAHEEFIASKKAAAMAAKAKKAPTEASDAAKEVAPEEAWEAEQKAAMELHLYEAAAAIVGELSAIEAEGRNEGEDEDEIHDEQVEEAIVTDKEFAPKGWVPEEEQPNNQATE
jgi:hypothetical protein